MAISLFVAGVSGCGGNSESVDVVDNGITDISEDISRGVAEDAADVAMTDVSHATPEDVFTP